MISIRQDGTTRAVNEKLPAASADEIKAVTEAANAMVDAAKETERGIGTILEAASMISELRISELNEMLIAMNSIANKATEVSEKVIEAAKKMFDEVSTARAADIATLISKAEAATSMTKVATNAVLAATDAANSIKKAIERVKSASKNGMNSKIKEMFKEIDVMVNTIDTLNKKVLEAISNTEDISTLTKLVSAETKTVYQMIARLETATDNLHKA